MYNEKDFEYFQKIRTEMIKYIPENSKTILDIGCATGAFLEEIQKDKTIETWGVEIFEESAKIAETKLHKVLNCSVELALEKLPLGYFDCIICNDVLEHLVDPFIVLKNIKNLLSTNGKLITSIPNVRFIPNLHKLVIKKDWKYENWGGILDDTHLRFFTEKSIINTFNDCGYTVDLIEGINPIKLIKYKIFIFLTFGMFRDSKYLQFASVCSVKQK